MVSVMYISYINSTFEGNLKRIKPERNGLISYLKLEQHLGTERHVLYCK